LLYNDYMAENKDKQVVNSIVVPGMRKAFRDIPVEQRKYIKNLTGNETPLHPLPPDPYEGVTYVVFHEPKCSICSSPYRTQLEPVFLANGESPSAVAQYFWYHYGVMVNPDITSVLSIKRYTCNFPSGVTIVYFKII